MPEKNCRRRIVIGPGWSSSAFQRRKRIVKALVALILPILLTACEIEETLRINPDGSGTYVAKIAIDKEFAGAISDLKEKAIKDGYRVLEESETPDRKVLVVRRDFNSVSELNDESDSYALTISRPGGGKSKYSLAISIGSNAAANGFQKRTMRVSMPVPVETATAGSARGKQVEWDCVAGGTLKIEAAGWAIPFGVTPIAIVGAALIVALAIILRRFRKSPAVCVKCGNTRTPSDRFCSSCGTAYTSQGPSVSRVAVLAGVAGVGLLVLLVLYGPAVIGRFRNAVAEKTAARAAIVPAQSVAPAVATVVEEGAKRSRADMRSIATAWEARAIDFKTYTVGEPADGWTLIAPENLRAALSPVYIRTLPLKDGWGHPFEFGTSDRGKLYFVRSLGRDGVEDPTRGANAPGPDTDIIFANGEFVASLPTQAPHEVAGESVPSAPRNPVVLLHLDEGGSELNDASDHGYNARAIGTAIVPGHHSYARRLTNDVAGIANEYLTLGDSPALNPPTAMTFEAWINPTSGAEGLVNGIPIVSREDSWMGDIAYIFEIVAPSALHLYDGEISLLSDVGVPLNEWSHVAFTLESHASQKTARVFLNGHMVGEQTVAGAIRQNALTTYVGRRWGIRGGSQYNRGFDGFIDEVKIWDLALSSKEIVLSARGVE